MALPKSTLGDPNCKHRDQLECVNCGVRTCARCGASPVIVIDWRTHVVGYWCAGCRGQKDEG